MRQKGLHSLLNGEKHMLFHLKLKIKKKKNYVNLVPTNMFQLHHYRYLLIKKVGVANKIFIC